MMGAFILYLVKATICLVVFSLFFRLLLMKETFFRFTRITLIAGLVVCSLLPLVKIGISHPNMIQRPIVQLERMVASYETPGESVLMKTGEATESHEESALAMASEEIVLMQPDEVTETHEEAVLAMAPGEKPIVSEKKMFPFFVFALYLFGVLAMCVRLGVSLRRLQLLIRNNPVTEHDGYRLVICREHIIPFSFFNYIVLSEADYCSNAREIILHEQMHIRYRHNLDILFSELFLMIHWFNPAVWSLYNDLREVHEYEADNAVIEQGIDAREYQLLLVKKAVGERRFTSVVNSFNQSKIKNRITMMLRKESNAWARLKLLFVVPLTAVLLLAFAQPERAGEQIVDDQSRNDAADYFLSLKKEKKDHYLAYLYLDTEDQLSLMSGNTDDASLKVINLKEESDLTGTLTDLITETIRKTASTHVDFMMGAENDTKMKSVSFVKNAMRDAYNISCERVSKEKNVLLEELKKEFPLSIAYTSVQASSPGSIAKQVQTNPFFYWEEVQQFCTEKGINPKDMEIRPGTNQTQRLLVILINSINQIMFQNRVSSEVFKTPEEGNSAASVQALKKMIVETIEMNDPDPVYFTLQHDIAASTQFIFTFLGSTLPAAYEAALNEISERDNIPVDRLRKEKPLLLLHGIPKNYSGNANSEVQQEERKSNAFILRTSVMKDGKEDNAFYTIVRHNEGPDIQTVSVRREIFSDESGNESVRQEAVFASTLEPSDMALVSVGADLTTVDMNGVKTMLDKKFKAKKSIFVLRM